MKSSRVLLDSLLVGLVGLMPSSRGCVALGLLSSVFLSNDCRNVCLSEVSFLLLIIGQHSHIFGSLAAFIADGPVLSLEYFSCTYC